MKLKENTYYCKYLKFPDEEEVASLCFYYTVGDDFYSVDFYTIDIEGFDFEDASWVGVDTNQDPFETEISSETGKKWLSLYENTRREICDIIEKTAEEITRDLSSQDILVDGKDGVYDLFEIANSNGSNEYQLFVFLNDYQTYCYSEHVEPDYNETYEELIQHCRVIPKKIGIQIRELIKQNSKHLMQLIKDSVNEIYYQE